VTAREAKRPGHVIREGDLVVYTSRHSDRKYVLASAYESKYMSIVYKRLYRLVNPVSEQVVDVDSSPVQILFRHKHDPELAYLVFEVSQGIGEEWEGVSDVDRCHWLLLVS
jgi:hypothetical protein